MWPSLGSIHQREDDSSRNGTVACVATGSELSAAATGDAAAGDAGSRDTGSGDTAGGGSGVSAGAGNGGAGGVGGKAWGVGSDKKGGVKGNDNVSKSELDMYVDQCAWRVLHAASRTASGGDCFFVVQVRKVYRSMYCILPILYTIYDVCFFAYKSGGGVCYRSIPGKVVPCAVCFYWRLVLF